MQDLSRSLILLNGELKTLQIASIHRISASAYRVCFKNNQKAYTYSADKVLWLTDPQWMIPDLCNVYREGRLQTDVTEIWQFDTVQSMYWRIKYRNGFEAECDESQMTVAKTCLDDTTSRDTLAYLRQVAAINPLSRDEGSLLAQIYDRVTHVDDKTAAACYLNPDKYKIQRRTHRELIYPFGCNASQKKAVATAFEHQVSVIQGPPGTGKTQTILNIIANIVRDNKTVLVVSNNNSATANIQEKLEKYGIAFIAAPLGRQDNKEMFIRNQTSIPEGLSSWSCLRAEERRMRGILRDTLLDLDKVYELLNQEAQLRQELQAIDLEWRHFCRSNAIDEHSTLQSRSQASLILKLWLHYQSRAGGTAIIRPGIWSRIAERIRALRMWIICRYKLRLKSAYDKANVQPLVIELQTLYYLNRRMEIEELLEEVKQALSGYNADALTKSLTETSANLLKASIHNKYDGYKEITLHSISDIHYRWSEFIKRYPVVLSTTFSARSCSVDSKPYDYIIMDEASQVSVETGALALTCAYNAVIVGDTMQLPNVVTDKDRVKLATIMQQYHISDGYDCSKHSFLESVRAVINNVPEIVLREHYRCHPRIINFCNQKFYGGTLIIMTHDHGEEDVLCAHLTVKGNHATRQYNQREIDVVREEVLPSLTSYDDIGIVTPYNNQVDQFHQQIPDLDVATIHKYQGREKDAIIMSTVDNQITPFADDANLLNVAVSRAKKKFHLVMTGNEQTNHGNLMDLLDYIHYNNCTITNSKIASIFDYLYAQYTSERMALLEKLPQVSEYASENMTYHLICDILASDNHFSHLRVLCHMPLRLIIQDSSLMSPEELAYASNYNTHIDFLIISSISKKPLLGIETDGYSFHNNATEQHKRDELKNRILALYSIPLIRLSTKGSQEREKIIDMLISLCDRGHQPI